MSHYSVQRDILKACLAVLHALCERDDESHSFGGDLLNACLDVHARLVCERDGMLHHLLNDHLKEILNGLHGSCKRDDESRSVESDLLKACMDVLDAPYERDDESHSQDSGDSDESLKTCFDELHVSCDRNDEYWFCRVFNKADICLVIHVVKEYDLTHTS